MQVRLNMKSQKFLFIFSLIPTSHIHLKLLEHQSHKVCSLQRIVPEISQLCSA